MNFILSCGACGTALALILGASPGAWAGDTASGPAARPFISVKDYGAVCDGVRDDHAELQSAMNHAAGGFLMFADDPSVICLTSVALVAAAKTAIIGKATLKPTAGNISVPMLLDIQVSHVWVRGITIDGGGRDHANNGNVAQLYGGRAPVDDVVFEDVHFRHTNGIAWLASTGITNSGVRNSTFVDTGNHWKTTALTGDRQPTIVFCCGANADNHGNFARDNVFHDIGKDAISATQQHDFKAIGNQCDMANGALTFTWHDPQPVDFAACVYSSYSDQVTIALNHSDGASGNAFDTYAVTDRIIVGNFAANSGVVGIGAFNGGTALIVGNTVKNNGRWVNAGISNGKAGIAFDGAMGKIVLTANHAYDDDAGSQSYGVYAKPGTIFSETPSADKSNNLAVNAVGAFGGTFPGAQ